MRLTLPQTIMLNYEAWATNDRWERKREYEKKHETHSGLDEETENDPDKIDAYMANIANFSM